MSNLPVNFSDDILNASMNGRRRYQMITNSDGTVSFLDVTNYDNFGSDYGAAEVNELNKIVNGKVEQDDVLQTLEQISANTDSNKIAGATALRELNNKTTLIYGNHANAVDDGSGIMLSTIPYPDGYTFYNTVILAAYIDYGTVKYQTMLYSSGTNGGMSIYTAFDGIKVVKGNNAYWSAAGFGLLITKI